MHKDKQYKDTQHKNKQYMDTQPNNKNETHHDDFVRNNYAASNNT